MVTHVYSSHHKEKKLGFQATLQKEPRSFGEKPCASPSRRPPSSSTASMATPKKEANHLHIQIWQNTFAYKDVFRADEPDRREQ
jgi:hypothetical protein